ncbi:PucR family transcriptional regulator [Nonomuraea jiangxiensis]|uniref:PucR C-terminal helix-turn-helix domain-containing protein n=1 Tax=Nonomuraea jiangxiensis TaxID=633440 RepID=A0A1G9H8H0_9ACTN|nr:helix-turn-helix domain-containing protein [Nonomuraea jiangxiensis]SDL09135.1 PucR C-terminal helix-turn-helix domain-containing protein [Nonomuraea jiangxiensis]
MASGVVDRLSRELVRDVAPLADRFVAEVVLIGGPYAGTVIPEGILLADARRSLELILRLIGRLSVPEHIAGASAEIGAARAEAGVPLDTLLQAVRFDARIVWEELCRRAGPGDVAGLVAEAPRVWEAVEHHSMSILAAYQQRVLEMAQAQQDERARWFARLLECDGRHPDIRRQVATVLGLDEHASFAVVALPPDCLATFRPLREQLDVLGVRVHAQDRPAGSVAVLQLPARSGSAAEGWFRGVRCAVSPVVDGLAEVPRAVRLAELSLYALPPDAAGPHNTRDLWPAIASGALGEFRADLVRDALGGLGELPARDVARILETVERYLSTGSVVETARQLYCHRNTVLNRLRQFAVATGRDVMTSTDATVVTLALRARAYE